MKIAVKTLDNKKSGDIELKDDVFGVEPRVDLLHRMVTWQLAKRRAGTRQTKRIGDIVGNKKKPFRQKGTGRARQGSQAAGIRRGGAKAFGPLTRDHGFSLPKKVRKLALKSALSAKAKEGSLVVLDEAKPESHKTADLHKRFQALGLSSALVIDGEAVDAKFALAARNLPYVDVLPELGANVHDILRRDTLVLTKAAVEKLEARLS
ncbi:MAG: 50S ribosomal protein L4 [Pseudomonadota bacterium]